MGGVAAVGLVFLDDIVGHVVFIQSHLAFITLKVDAVDFGVIVGQACRPVEVRHAKEGALHAANKTELVAVDEMVAALDAFNTCVWVKSTGLEAVEAEELVFLGIEIGHIKEEFRVFDDVRHIAVEAEYARAFGVT